MTVSKRNAKDVEHPAPARALSLASPKSVNTKKSNGIREKENNMIQLEAIGTSKKKGQGFGASIYIKNSSRHNSTVGAGEGM